MKKQYFQFSKRCVVAVLIGVNILTFVALIGMIVVCDYSSIGNLMNGYFSFATIVFACYSTNSLGEKIATKITDARVNQLTQEESGNG